MANKDAAEPEPLDFAEMIADLGHGATNRQATELLAQIVAACEETGGKGRLVLTISVETDGRGIAALASTAKATIPQPKLPGGSYFRNKAGGLVTEDPRQQTLGPRILSMPTIKRNPDDGGNAS